MLQKILDTFRKDEIERGKQPSASASKISTKENAAGEKKSSNMRRKTSLGELIVIIGTIGCIHGGIQLMMRWNSVFAFRSGLCNFGMLSDCGWLDTAFLVLKGTNLFFYVPILLLGVWLKSSKPDLQLSRETLRSLWEKGHF